MAAKATQEDAKLLLQLYDLRREKLLRRARDFVSKELKFKDLKDFQKRYPEGSKEANHIGMVVGYWNLACTLVEKGLVDEELFNATNFEHVDVWFKLRPVIEAWRKEFKFADLMRPLETVAARHPGAAFFTQTKPAGGGKK